MVGAVVGVGSVSGEGELQVTGHPAVAVGKLSDEVVAAIAGIYESGLRDLVQVGGIVGILVGNDDGSSGGSDVWSMDGVTDGGSHVLHSGNIEEWDVVSPDGIEGSRIWRVARSGDGVFVTYGIVCGGSGWRLTPAEEFLASLSWGGVWDGEGIGRGNGRRSERVWAT